MPLVLGLLACSLFDGACTDAQSLLDSGGGATGYTLCADGAVDRTEALPVPPAHLHPDCTGDEWHTTCYSDSACTDGPHGRCASYTLYADMLDTGGPNTVCQCEHHCELDSDCQADEACVAPARVGGGGSAQCVAANCRVDADCASGECGLAATESECGVPVPILACRDPVHDECRSDADCPVAGETCGPWGDGGRYACESPPCWEE